VAVAATLDIISSALEYMQRPRFIMTHSSHIPVPPGAATGDESCAVRANSVLSDEILFNCIFPTFESALIPPQNSHTHQLAPQSKGAPRSFAGSASGGDAPGVLSQSSPRLPELAEEDLLGALKSLASVRFDDVRIDIIGGLLALLQGGGHTLSAGWAAIIELLESVAASLVDSDDDAAGAELPAGGGQTDASSGSRRGDDISRAVKAAAATDDDANAEHSRWPRAALPIAFNAMKLIVDEFLDTMPLELVKAVIVCLSVFTEQGVDVNISLTSVEMLWKVADVAMSRKPTQQQTPTMTMTMTPTLTLGSTSLDDSMKGAPVPPPAAAADDDQTSFQVLDVMMSRLQRLSTDKRPEVRIGLLPNE
jgi:hypothetical protein